MNEKEKKSFYIATCKCCLLADVMKNCAACQFNIGLAEKPELIELQPFSRPLAISIFPPPYQLIVNKT